MRAGKDGDQGKGHGQTRKGYEKSETSAASPVDQKQSDSYLRGAQ